MMNTHLTLRPFCTADAPALAHVFRSAIEQLCMADYTPIQREQWLAVCHDPIQWQTRMEHLQPWVAELNGTTIVGYADLQPTGEIDHCFVHPAAARHGVGRALLNHIEHCA